MLIEKCTESSQTKFVTLEFHYEYKSSTDFFGNIRFPALFFFYI